MTRADNISSNLEGLYLAPMPVSYLLTCDLLRNLVTNLTRGVDAR